MNVFFVIVGHLRGGAVAERLEFLGKRRTAQGSGGGKRASESSKALVSDNPTYRRDDDSPINQARGGPRGVRSSACRH